MEIAMSLYVDGDEDEIIGSLFAYDHAACHIELGKIYLCKITIKYNTL